MHTHTDAMKQSGSHTSGWESTFWARLARQIIPLVTFSSNGVTKATGEEGDGVTGGQVVLHLGVIACDGQHLEDDVPGLQVGHRLSMQISAVWGERTIIDSPYLGKQPTITLVPRPYHNPCP